MFRLQDTLQPVPNETKMVVRLGRALKPGEFRVKLSLLEINKPEFFKPLLDSIVYTQGHDSEAVQGTGGGGGL